MSITSDFARWQAGCCYESTYGITSGDTMYGGFCSYSQPYPCPTGMDVKLMEFSEIKKLAAYRRLIEKAKRDIETHAAEQRVRELAESFTENEIQTDLEEIRTWARSLQKTEASHNGWIRLTPHEAA